MQVETVSIGNELLWGYTVNTNASFLSREMSLQGYTVARQTTIPDAKETIQAGLKEALSRSAIVIATGGLGPTLDDLTFESATPLFSAKPEALKNFLGTAPGAFFFDSGKALILLPGVPSEMERMFLEEAMPRIKRHFPLKHLPFIRRCSLCLLREVEVDPFLRELKEKHPHVEIGIYPSLGSLQVVFRSDKPVESLVRQLQEKFPTFSFGGEKIEKALQHEMVARKKTLGLAESITGGAISARLTSIPDASHFLLGSIVAYSNAWKERYLQVSHSTIKQEGSVSKKAVEEMVDGLFAETDADYAIAVSGIAGPSGGTKQKPVGSIYIAIGQRGKKTDVGLIQSRPDRASAIELTVQTALGALWRRLVHNTFTFS